MQHPAPPSPRHLLMNLVRAAETGCLSAAEAVAAGELFGISGNAVRVTLARLTAAGLIEAAARGVYRIGPAGLALDQEVSAWRDAEQRLVPWNGRWIAVHIAGSARADRAAARARDRALSLLGLRALEPGLLLRPDNLCGGAGSVRARLVSLGIGPEVPVFGADQFDPERDRRARALWDVAALTRLYRDGADELQSWLRRSSRRADGAAAREAFLLGDQAIRRLVFDPLLPDPLVDGALRRRYRDAVIAFDEAGRSIWRTFLLAAGKAGAPA